MATIRSARLPDVPRTAELSAAKRAGYEARSPVFWRKS